MSCFTSRSKRYQLSRFLNFHHHDFKSIVKDLDRFENRSFPVERSCFQFTNEKRGGKRDNTINRLNKENQFHYVRWMKWMENYGELLISRIKTEETKYMFFSHFVLLENFKTHHRDSKIIYSYK